MPPIKTYTRKSTINRSHMQLVTSLMFNNPISKKKTRKNKLVIKQLLPHVCEKLLNESSVVLRTEDTFDRLLKREKNDDFNGTKRFNPNISALNGECTKNSGVTTKQEAIQTRSKCKETLKNSLKRKIDTLDLTVDESLCIEKEKVKEQTPSFTFNFSITQDNLSVDQTKHGQQLFNDSFKRRLRNTPKYISLASSTPIIDITKLEVTNVLISPITNGVTRTSNFKTPKPIAKNKIKRVIADEIIGNRKNERTFGKLGASSCHLDVRTTSIDAKFVDIESKLVNSDSKLLNFDSKSISKSSKEPSKSVVLESNIHGETEEQLVAGEKELNLIWSLQNDGFKGFSPEKDDAKNKGSHSHSKLPQSKTVVLQKNVIVTINSIENRSPNSELNEESTTDSYSKSMVGHLSEQFTSKGVISPRTYTKLPQNLKNNVNTDDQSNISTQTRRQSCYITLRKRKVPYKTPQKHMTTSKVENYSSMSEIMNGTGKSSSGYLKSNHSLQCFKTNENSTTFDNARFTNNKEKIYDIKDLNNRNTRNDKFESVIASNVGISSLMEEIKKTHDKCYELRTSWQENTDLSEFGTTKSSQILRSHSEVMKIDGRRDIYYDLRNEETNKEEKSKDLDTIVSNVEITNNSCSHDSTNSLLRIENSSKFECTNASNTLQSNSEINNEEKIHKTKDASNDSYFDKFYDSRNYSLQNKDWRNLENTKASDMTQSNAEIANHMEKRHEAGDSNSSHSHDSTNFLVRIKNSNKFENIGVSGIEVGNNREKIDDNSRNYLLQNQVWSKLDNRKISNSLQSNAEDTSNEEKSGKTQGGSSNHSHSDDSKNHNDTLGFSARITNDVEKIYETHNGCRQSRNFLPVDEEPRTFCNTKELDIADESFKITNNCHENCDIEDVDGECSRNLLDRIGSWTNFDSMKEALEAKVDVTNNDSGDIFCNPGDALNKKANLKRLTIKKFKNKPNFTSVINISSGSEGKNSDLDSDIDCSQSPSILNEVVRKLYYQEVKPKSHKQTSLSIEQLNNAKFIDNNKKFAKSESFIPIENTSKHSREKIKNDSSSQKENLESPQSNTIVNVSSGSELDEDFDVDLNHKAIALCKKQPVVYLEQLDVKRTIALTSKNIVVNIERIDFQKITNKHRMLAKERKYEIQCKQPVVHLEQLDVMKIINGNRERNSKCNNASEKLVRRKSSNKKQGNLLANETKQKSITNRNISTFENKDPTTKTPQTDEIVPNKYKNSNVNKVRFEQQSQDSHPGYSTPFKHLCIEDFIQSKPGKSFRRSLVSIRKSRVGCSSGNRNCVDEKGIVCTCVQCKRTTLGDTILPKRLSVRVVPLSPIASPGDRRFSYLENYAVSIYPSYISDGVQESLLENYIEDLSLTGKSLNFLHSREPELDSEISARDVVLRKCKQSEPLPFEKCYPNSILRNCQKIGEGVYGEVFLFRNPNGGITVMKIIPIEGNLIVNGERQKKFEEILTEITIAMELSNLRNNVRNNTNGFSELQKVMCVRGKYPDRLLQLWELYEESRGTENDSPQIFGEDQLYIVLELANGGKDMEAYVFNNSQQAFALFKQTACALAVAEASLEFEHRDLHWGNILIENVEQKKKVSYYLHGKKIELDTNGVQLSIIDYTLSRIKHDGVCIYNDLSLDPDLFNAKGDYQFDIYRLMREANKNSWQHFEPYTNVLWLSYILEKMITALRYKNKTSKIHKEHIKKLQKLRSEILSYKSADEFVIKCLI